MAYDPLKLGRVFVNANVRLYVYDNDAEGPTPDGSNQDGSYFKVTGDFGKRVGEFLLVNGGSAPGLWMVVAVPADPKEGDPITVQKV